MNPLKPLLLWFKDRTARKAEREARERLAELVEQTRSSYEHRRYLERRAAALKGAAIKRERAHG
jgi:hypothetical protein